MRARLNDNSRPAAQFLSARVETAAFYGAFALIAAIVFGTLTVHPF